MGSDHALDSPGFDSFARENPAAAFDAAVGALATASDGSEVGRLLGKLTTAENFERARSAILALDSRRRLDAVWAIDWMQRRGVDVSSLAPVIDELRVVLERTPSVPLEKAEEKDVLRALAKVRSSRVTWSDTMLGAARALESHPNETVAEAARGTVRTILDERSRGTDAWDPER